MNKYLLGLVFLLFIFSSCSKDEDLASGLSGYWKQVPPMTTEKCAVPIKKKTSPFCSKQTEFTGCLIPALKRNMPEHGL